MNKISLLILAVLLFATPVFAAPSIGSVQGVILQNQSVSITCTSAGQKSPVKPYIWAPFDSSLNPSSLGIITAWDGTNAIEWNASEGINGGGCAKASDSSGNWTAYAYPDGFYWNDYDQKCYMFRKLKENFDMVDFHGPGVPLNWKEWRVWSGGAGTAVDSYFAPSFRVAFTEGVTWPNGVGYNGDSYVLAGTQDQYNTKELWYQSNSSASNTSSDPGDGIFEIWVNGVRAYKLPSGSKYWKNRQTDSANMIKFYAIHGVKANAIMPETARYWVDDLYVDNTWARVMIGNASTLESSTQREIQIPTAWSDTEITIEFNQGSFNTNDTAYLFVIDEDGNASAGYPLTIGAVNGVPATITASGPGGPVTITASGPGGPATISGN